MKIHQAFRLAYLVFPFRSVRKAFSTMILFDELDAIALDRVDANDLREMGRATSAILREFDDLSKDVILFATTNLYKNLDKALVRRFDAVINFNRYTQKDLAGIAVQIFDKLSPFYRGIGKNERFFSKIIACMAIRANTTPMIYRRMAAILPLIA